MSSPLDAQTRRFRRPPTGLTVERAERGSPNSNTRGRTTVEVRTGMQIAARRHWHGVRANMTEGSAGPAGLSPTLRAHTTAGHRVNRTCPSVLGQLIPPPWDTRSISGSNIRPRAERISPPCATSDSAIFAIFAWGAYAFLANMVRCRARAVDAEFGTRFAPKLKEGARFGGGKAR